jgi:diacylglycerol kinase (ATP)
VRRLSPRERLRSFAHAGRGLAWLLASQPNAWVHAAATAAALALAAALGLDAAGWCWIVLAVALVWIAEGLNTALEALADAVAPERDPAVGRAKDVAAAAVLVAAAAAAVIGLLVLGPPLWTWLRGSTAA